MKVSLLIPFGLGMIITAATFGNVAVAVLGLAFVIIGETRRLIDAQKN